MTGTTIALYTVVDGIGVRDAGGTTIAAAAYTAWLFLLFFLTLAIYISKNGLGAVRAPAKDMAAYATGGLVLAGAYGIVIWAMQSGAMGGSSELRELVCYSQLSSGHMFLKEELISKKMVACVVIVLGAVIISTWLCTAALSQSNAEPTET